MTLLVPAKSGEITGAGDFHAGVDAMGAAQRKVDYRLRHPPAWTQRAALVAISDCKLN